MSSRFVKLGGLNAVFEIEPRPCLFSAFLLKKEFIVSNANYIKQTQ